MIEAEPTTAISKIAPPPKTQEPKPSLEWLGDFLRSSGTGRPVRIYDEASADMVEEVVARVSTPAAPDQIAKMAVNIISQYFASAMPQETTRATAEMWMHRLSSYPAWAIKRATFWWVGPENPEKRRMTRPQSGDIAERAEIEMAIVRIAEYRLGLWRKYRGDYPHFLQ